MLTLAQLQDALTSHRPQRFEPPREVSQRAAVAMTLAGAPDALSLCVIQRARRPGDPGSGQMAFPGGRAQADDVGPVETARRETREEVGLHLTAAALLGSLDEISMRRRMRGPGGVVSPFVFYAGAELPSLSPRPGEVAQAWWIPLRHLWGGRHRTSLMIRDHGARVAFPGIVWEGRTIWGLSYRILGSLAKTVGRPLVDHSG